MFEHDNCTDNERYNTIRDTLDAMYNEFKSTIENKQHILEKRIDRILEDGLIVGVRLAEQTELVQVQKAEIESLKLQHDKIVCALIRHAKKVYTTIEHGQYIFHITMPSGEKQTATLYTRFSNQ